MVRRAAGGTGLLERDEDAPSPASLPVRVPAARNVTRTAGRVVAALVGLNLVVQVALVAVVLANDLDRLAAVRISLVTGVVFYAAAAMATRRWAVRLDLRPRTGRRQALAGVAEGIVVGAGAAVLLNALLRLASGRPQLDPASATLAAGGTAWLLLGVLVVVVVAPVVEELVFRGFLLEAFRGRGRRSAVLVSGVAFSLAHLQLAQFRYYLVMGVAFALVYWRRGLIGSVSAHAGFNGALVLVAVAALHAPPRDVSAAGFTVSVPAAWATATGVSGDDLVAVGPLGTKVELAHIDAPGPVSPDALARDLARGSVTLPARVSVDPASVTQVDLPGGRSVTMAARIDGRDGRVTMVARGRRLWVATVRSAGDGSAAGFERIVRSWRLP
jgi:membrane protease YdiL (CAAX protease family)